MNECEFHCALCPEKCTLAAGHFGFCNCGGHYDFKHPQQPCKEECSNCYNDCILVGQHEFHRCADHKDE